MTSTFWYIESLPHILHIRLSMAISDKIARRIRHLRTAQGLTLELLSERSGLPTETLSRIERQRMMPSLRSLEHVAKGLGVTLPVLLADDPVLEVEVSGISPEVRAIALLLAGKPPTLIHQVRRIVEVLIEEPHADKRDIPS